MTRNDERARERERERRKGRNRNALSYHLLRNTAAVGKNTHCIRELLELHKNACFRIYSYRMDGFNIVNSANRVQARYNAKWYIYTDNGMWRQRCGGGIDKTQVLALLTAPSEKTLRPLISIILISGSGIYLQP